MGRRHCGSKNTADGCTDERRPSAERAAAKFGCGIEASEAQPCALRRRYRSHRAVQQAEDQSVGMKHSGLRGIPSVDKLALALGDMGLPHPTVVAAIRRELAALRKHGTIPRFDDILLRLRSGLEILRASRIQPVINGTGILVHTNFGRAPLGHAVMEAVSQIGSQYNNLEYGLAEGGRGNRAAYLEQNLALICDAEAATVVNNNASALILILRHFCEEETRFANGERRNTDRRIAFRRNHVVISRGELIQIGGGFRIPEILEASGAQLCEIGTTNKTSVKDYARAFGPDTALILKVHRSNFFMGGFIESPSTESLARLARTKRIPFVEDLGSGAIVATEELGAMEHEPRPNETLRSGVELVCSSGDKLFGGPQAGIIAGK